MTGDNPKEVSATRYEGLVVIEDCATTRSLTDADLEAIEAAKRKRERKAAKKAKGTP